MIDALDAQRRPPATIRHVLGVASAIFRMAVRHQLIRHNPVAGMSDDGPRKKPRDIEPLERDELTALLAEARKRENGDPELPPTGEAAVWSALASEDLIAVHQDAGAASVAMRVGNAFAAVTAQAVAAQRLPIAER